MLVSQPLPYLFSFLLETEMLPKNERLDAWKEILDPIFDITSLINKQDFQPSFNFHMLNGAVFGKAKFQPQKFSRNRYSKAGGGDEYDYIYIQAILSGGCIGHNGTNAFYASAGDVVFYDLGFPTTSQTDYCDCINLFLPRAYAYEYGVNFFKLGLVLKSGSKLNKILVSYIKSVYYRINTLDYIAASDLMGHLVHLISCCLDAINKGEDTLPSSEILQSAQLDRVCYWIESNLANPEISVDLICKSTYVSRATLYRLLNHHGGIASYLHLRRLEKCLSTIFSSTYDHLTIAEISHYWGYSTYPQFSRLFKKRYGISPKDARALRDSIVVAASVKFGFDETLAIKVLSR